MRLQSGCEVYITIAFSVYDEARGLDDASIIKKANFGNYILITNDRYFGELIFRMKRPHKGVILLLLKDERNKNKIAVLRRELELYSDKLANNFITVTEKTVRIVGERRGRRGDSFI